MPGADPRIKIKVQIMCGTEIALGPGKADLLEAIQTEGSISAAGRALGMSYRRAWLLVDTMNRCWDLPLVEAFAGGGKGAGARVTEFGIGILKHYREMQEAAQKAEAGEEWSALSACLRPSPRAAQGRT